MSERILIIGAGAIGAFYGAALQTAGANVSVVCRSELDAVRANGFSIESKRLGNRTFKPVQTLGTASDYQGGAPDYVVVSVKVVEGTDRAALIRDAVGPGTAIVLIENGVEIEAEIAQAFPDNELISALAFVQVSRVAPGKVRHFAFGDLSLGNYPSSVTERTKRFAALLETGGIKCTMTEDVVTVRWQKCLWNAVFNPISVMGGVLDTGHILGAPEGELFVRQAMREVCAVAAATGHPLDETLVGQYVEGTRKAPPYKTSMALDYENGRPMETEVILGNAVRAARRENVAIPALEALYALMKMVERKTALI
ncbi:ketopantoate reductase family protein [Noviherbaspirillum denitrificans]|uniref:2-dehydropantoate 2-reductase n=1 Tax=Noviherbaspirillum denitrificans TaxID=1968433 RepID=A0A254TBK4_9BURK|nr:2-dehydropantoate 2-reductase [Noviherbaspirillum denitrificans]OWW20036.1 2-dehydropantoate 2-reductase [Noviherbaspirillum denitrificans]